MQQSFVEAGKVTNVRKTLFNFTFLNRFHYFATHLQLLIYYQVANYLCI
jgi:hypothetical protein